MCGTITKMRSMPSERAEIYDDTIRTVTARLSLLLPGKHCNGVNMGCSRCAKSGSLSNRHMISTVPQPPLRALVVGAGPAAIVMHLPVLARLRDKSMIALASICDVNEQRAASARRKFGFLEQCGDAATALTRPDIDVIFLFVNAPQHHQLGLAAIRAGKHLFVEKPIAGSFAQAREMAEAAQAARIVAV